MPLLRREFDGFQFHQYQSKEVLTDGARGVLGGLVFESESSTALLYNSSYSYTLPVLLNAVDIALIRFASDPRYCVVNTRNSRATGANISITALSHPLP